MYPDWLNEIIRCPQSAERLTPTGNQYLRQDGYSYQIYDGILSAVYPKQIVGVDAKMNKLYNILAPLYDLNERVLVRLFTGVDIVAGRERIVSRLKLKPGMKILEVSPGPGVFQKYLRKELGNDGKIVSLDLSMNMLKQCQIKSRDLDVYLIHGNAQHLPFCDNSFDALFHFGGVNLFNEPEKAINEFVRVVKKDGIVSWGDEGFSKEYPNNLRKKLMAKINPGFAMPRPSIPQGLYDVKEHEVYDGLAYLVTAKKK